MKKTNSYNLEYMENRLKTIQEELDFFSNVLEYEGLGVYGRQLVDGSYEVQLVREQIHQYLK